MHFFFFALFYFCLVGIEQIMTISDNLFDDLWKRSGILNMPRKSKNVPKIKDEPFDEHSLASADEKANTKFGKVKKENFEIFEKNDKIKQEEFGGSESHQFGAIKIKTENAAKTEVKEENENYRNLSEIYEKWNKNEKEKHVISRTEQQNTSSSIYTSSSTNYGDSNYTNDDASNYGNDDGDSDCNNDNDSNYDNDADSNYDNDNDSNYYNNNDSNYESEYSTANTYEDDLDDNDYEDQNEVTNSKSPKLKKKEKRYYSESEKEEFVRKYNQIQREKPEMTDEETAQMLNIPRRTIFRWRKQLAEKIKLSENDEMREIVREFERRKEQLAQQWGRVPERRKQNKIAKELGVSARAIAFWKKEFGEEKNDLKNEKLCIVNRFNKMKKQWPQMTNKQIANKMGIRLGYIYESRLLFQQSNKFKCHNDAEKKELLKLYEKIKKKHPELDQEKIGKILNVTGRTLANWKNQFYARDSKKKCKSAQKKKMRNYTNLEKIELLKKSYKIKEENPRITGNQLSDILGITIQTLGRWKKKFTEKEIL